VVWNQGRSFFEILSLNITALRVAVGRLIGVGLTHASWDQAIRGAAMETRLIQTSTRLDASPRA
jgi:hypothetical protein